MSDPLSLVPFALGAREGVIDGWPVRQLVAAGVAALRGSAPLVRALGGKRSAILLPAGPLVYTGMAASDGRSALVLDPRAPVDEEVLADAGVGAVFTTDALQRLVPPEVARVLLDHAPVAARYVHGERDVPIDLTMHEGLTLEGDVDAPGSNEEMLLMPSADGEHWTALTHRALLARARASIVAAGLVASDHVLVLRDATDAGALAAGEMASLLAGAHVTTADPRNASRALEHLEQLEISAIVGRAAAFEGMTVALEQRRTLLNTHSLRRLLCVGPQLADAARARWSRVTGLTVAWIAVPDA